MSSLRHNRVSVPQHIITDPPNTWDSIELPLKDPRVSSFTDSTFDTIFPIPRTVIRQRTTLRMNTATFVLLLLVGLNLFHGTDSFSARFLRRPLQSLTRIHVVAPQRNVDQQLQIYNGESSAVVPITEMIRTAGKQLPTMVSMFFTEGREYLIEYFITCHFSSPLLLSLS